MPKQTPLSLRDFLTGGDRRSIAKSGAARLWLREHPEGLSDLAALAEDKDWLVVMRSMDLLEKLAQEERATVEPYKRVFIGPVADAEQWEIRLQVVRALGLFHWTRRDRRRVIEILQRDMNHPRLFVRAWALDSLATLSKSDVRLIPIVKEQLRKFEQSGSRALAARARQIRKRI